MWKRLSIAALLTLASSCATALPAWHGKFYQADHKAVLGMDGVPHGGIVRKQANEVIQADDPAFDAFMAMRWTDFQSFVDTFVFSCKDWDQRQPVNLDQIKAFFQSLKGKP